VSLAEDVALTWRVLAAPDGPTILVGHSFGGAVITEAENHPTVEGPVYVAAFAPDAGESVSALINLVPHPRSTGAASRRTRRGPGPSLRP
jgi:pimeloyl-ACP methyl ester carboxylesterase